MKMAMRVLSLTAVMTILTFGAVAVAQDTVPGDHYKCYRAKGDFEKVPDVGLLDQFDVSTTAVVIKPAFICNPVEKTVGGVTSEILNPDLHYVCYLIKEKPKVTPPDVFVSNQFQDDELLDVIKAKLLCVPSLKRQVTPPE